MKTEQVKLSQVKLNEANPRSITDDKFSKLVNSLLVLPKMMELRPIVVDGSMTALGGNMRCRALTAIAAMEEGEMLRRLKSIKEFKGKSKQEQDKLTAYWQKWHDCPTALVIKASELTDEEKREFIIKDNASFGSWDFDQLANEWDIGEITDWGVDLPEDWGEIDFHQGERDEDAELERKKKEFEERMAAGEISEEDEEYQEFLRKFELKKTTDDCYTPQIVYEAVAKWVAKEYGVKEAAFVRPFYPGGDYEKESYPKGCVVVDNPPFSILADILRFYRKRKIRFFLFAPALTLFSSSSSCTALPVGVNVIYENGAVVRTSFLTNLEPPSIRLRSAPSLYAAVKKANDENLEGTAKTLPKYVYDKHVIMAMFVSTLSRYGVDFAVPVAESEPIRRLDAQKESKKAIYGQGYLVSDRVAAEREKAEREKAEIWGLSERERAIVEKLNGAKK